MPVVTSELIGRTDAGEPVHRYLLRAGPLSADVMTYGAALMALRTPDREGRAENIVLGYDTLAPYLAGTPYFGATIGRYANRIAGAQFELEGRVHALAANNGRNHLHGGVRGFDKVVWRGESSADGVTLRYLSADGEEGYPGELSAEVSYTLSEDRLAISYCAETTRPTHVNLTHHSYFNLSGAALRSIETHDLSIDADFYTPVDDELIPLPDHRSVASTAFDFRTTTRIGAHINDADPQLIAGGGYDHNFVLNKSAPGEFKRAARLCDPVSGRTLELHTTPPGLQFYSGNHLDGAFGRRSGLCLEPQHFPNTPNRPDFPSTVLQPGEIYRSRTAFVFGVDS